MFCIGRIGIMGVVGRQNSGPYGGKKDGLGRGLSKYSLMCAFVMKCVRIGVMKKCGSHPKEREGEGVSIQTPTLLVCRERFEACGKKRRGGGRSPNDAGEPRGGTERLKCLLQLILGPVCRHFSPKSAHPEILANNGRRAQLPLLPVCEQLLTLKLKMNRLRACWFCWVFFPPFFFFLHRCCINWMLREAVWWWCIGGVWVSLPPIWLFSSAM